MTALRILTLILSGAALVLSLVALVVATRPRQPRHLTPPAERGGYPAGDTPPSKLSSPPSIRLGPGQYAPPGSKPPTATPPRAYCGQLAPTNPPQPCTLHPHPGSPMHEADNGMRWWFNPGATPGQPSGVTCTGVPLTELAPVPRPYTDTPEGTQP